MFIEQSLNQIMQLCTLLQHCSTAQLINTILSILKSVDHLWLVEMIRGFASLFPRHSLLSLPDRVHVTVVHTLAQHVLLQLQWASVAGRVSRSVVSWPAAAALMTTSSRSPLSHAPELVSSLRLLHVVVDRAGGLTVGVGADPGVSGLSWLNILSWSLVVSRQCSRSWILIQVSESLVAGKLSNPS